MSNFVEYFGYAASALVLLSFMMKNMRYLRLLNTVGCGCFIAYGLLLDPVSYPIIITNTAIVIINAYYLIKGQKESSN